MGMYQTFETDPNLESNGIWLDYGDFRVRIASASSGNKKYVKYAEKALKPVRKAMQVQAVSTERANGIMKDIYAHTIVLDWETKVITDEETGDWEWKKGIEPKDGGDLLPVNPETVKKTFDNLPALFIDIQEQAGAIANFRKAELEEEAKN